DRSWAPREVSELQRLDPASHAQIENVQLRRQILEVHGRTTPIIHRMHLCRYRETGETEWGPGRTAQGGSGPKGGLPIKGPGCVVVGHLFLLVVHTNRAACGTVRSRYP